MKVFELAKELDLKALDLLEKIRPLDLKIKNHMVDLSDEQIQRIRDFVNPPADVSSSAATADTTKKKAVARKKTVTTTKKEAASESEAPTSDSGSSRSVIVKTRRKVETVVEASDPVPVTAAGVPEEAPIEYADTQEPEDRPREFVEISPPEDLDAPSVAEVAHHAQTSGAMEDVLVSPEASASSAPRTTTVSTTQKAASAPVSSTATAVTPPAAPAPAGTVIRRGPRYSVIRVVSNEPAQRAKPLIVSEPEAGDAAKYGARSKTTAKTAAPKTFTDPELQRAGTNLIREEEDSKRNKRGGAPAKPAEEIIDFKSTDFLRRERVFQPKKKKLSVGQSFKRTQVTTAAAHKRVVEFDEIISVEELASQMSVKAFEVAKKLQGMGVEGPNGFRDLDQWTLDLDTTQLVAEEFEYEVRDVTFNEDRALEEIRQSAQIDDENQVTRPPVITIMGHVDHGKTSLLDRIRRARVAVGEAGGITQHIGAYQVRVDDAVSNLASALAEAAGDKKAAKAAKKEATKKEKGGKGSKAAGPGLLTFLDTPGHEAFTAIRSRGAKVTDIVVLVVAATEGIMPQTKEAIDHARAAEVPIIVAMNKMDLPDANPDRLKKELADYNLLSEDWGGETIVVPVSAKTGEGVDKLLEMIQLQAEMLDLKARAEGLAEGSIVEAKLDKGRGAVATVLIHKGTLTVGDNIVVGVQCGRVRAMMNDKGQQVREAGPSTPVEIIGLDGVPEAGDSLASTPDEKSAKALASSRAEQRREEDSKQKPLSLEDIFARMESGDVKELPVILKTDVKGSCEAIQAALLKIPSKRVKIKMVSAAVGGVSANDVLLASASKAIILGFSVRPDNKALSEAERLGVQIKSYDIIYNLIEEVTQAMEGLLDAKTKEVFMGRAEVRNVFTLSKAGTVAGCFVVKGKVQRANSVRLLRDSRVIYTGKLSGLKRFKDDAKEVAEGYECGMSIENFNDIKEGDVIEAFMIEQVRASLMDEAPAHA